jgi:hypothetical protein
VNRPDAADAMKISMLIDEFVIGMDRLFGTFPIRVDGEAAVRVLDLFVPDGILHTPFSRAEGRDEIRRGWDRVASFEAPADGPRYVQHHVTSREIVQVDPDTAHTTVYVQGITDRGLDHWGSYEDRVQKVAGEWKFVERVVTVKGCVPGGYYAGLPNPVNPVRHW